MLANSEPGARGLLALPYFMGERSPIWDAKSSGMFIGLGIEHRKSDLYRAILESTAFSLKHNIDLVKGKNLQLSNRLIVVGGTSKSKPWIQIIADVVQLPVYGIEEDVEAALGDAILAALGAGLITDLKIAGQWFTLNKIAEPNPDNAVIYNRLFAVYTAVYQKTKAEMAQLKTIAAAALPVLPQVTA